MDQPETDQTKRLYYDITDEPDKAATLGADKKDETQTSIALDHGRRV